MGLCCVWKGTVKQRCFLKSRSVMYRVVQMALLSSILGFLKSSHEGSAQVTFLLTVTCLLLVTVVLVLISDILPLHCLPQHHHHRRYSVASIVVAVHDVVSCIVLLPAALWLLLPPTPSTPIAVAAVLTLVVVLVLGLQCVENLQTACLPNPQGQQREERVTLSGQELHRFATRRYVPNTRRGRNREGSEYRRYTMSPPIPLNHTRASPPPLHTPNTRSMSSPPPSPNTPHTYMSHPSSPHTAPLSGVCLRQDVMLSDGYVCPRNADSPSVDTPATCPTHVSASACSQSPSHNPSFNTTTLVHVIVNPEYTVPTSPLATTTTYATPYTSSASPNQSSVNGNLPVAATTNTTPFSASNTTTLTQLTTNTTTPYTASDLNHSLVYENIPPTTTTIFANTQDLSGHYYSPVSYL